MISVAKILPITLGLFTSMAVWAETHTYAALTDFTDINAGAVPYYHHNGVNALAINAAIESYRDEFARATVEFEHSSGVYDVTITSLGETDGDGTFRFLVDGEVVGSAVNEPTTIDFSEQLHVFENITIPQGALIGVESIAVSNGLIPEGDAYAYARGRWTTLTIETADDNTPDPVLTADIAIDIASDKSEAETEETVSYTVTIENLSDDVIATNPLVVLTFPEQYNVVAGTECEATANSSVLTCSIPELQPQESIEFIVDVDTNEAGDYDVVAEVTTDQPDPVAGNNTVTASTLINGPVIVEPIVVEPIEPVENSVVVVPETVDLTLSLQADKSQFTVGDTVEYTLTLGNLSETTTATSATVGVLLPASLQFQASDICTANNQTVTCETGELTSGDSTTVSFTSIAVSVNTYSELLASASSAQPELNMANNEVQLVSSVVRAAPVQNVQPAPTLTNTVDAETQTDSSTKSTNSSGGGSFQTALFLLLLPCLINGLIRRRLS